MKVITSEMRRIALNQSNPHIAEMYASSETSTFIQNIRHTFNITNDLFIDLVGDIILGLQQKSEFSKIMLEEKICLTKETVQEIEKELSSLFDQTAEGTSSAPSSMLVPINNTQTLVPQTTKPTEIIRTIPPPPSPISGGAPLTREAVLESFSRSQTSTPAAPQKESKPTVGYAAYQAQKQNNPEPTS